MSLVQKMEAGYLQLLRVVFLLFATIAIIAVVILGAQFLSDRNAEPIPVTKKVELNASTYRFEDALPTRDNATVNENSSKVKDELFEQFVAVIESNAKKKFPDFVLNRNAIKDLFQGLEKNPTLGRSFIQKLIPVMDETYKNPKFKFRDVPEFGTKSYAIIEHFEADYRRQAAEIRAAKEEADINAANTRVSANAALISAASGFGIFVILILLVVLLKIERNLRNENPQPIAK